MHVWSIAFGCIIGWGSFVNPGKKFLPNSGVAGTAIAMVLGTLVMIIIAFSYAYMVPKYPKAGGEFTFTKECYGKIPRLRMRLVSRGGVSHERADEFHGDSAHYRGLVRRRLLQYVRRGFFQGEGRADRCGRYK